MGYKKSTSNNYSIVQDTQNVNSVDTEAHYEILYEINGIKKEPWNREDTRLNHSSYADSIAQNADVVKYKVAHPSLNEELRV